jgi:hypothetical protein
MMVVILAALGFASPGATLAARGGGHAAGVRASGSARGVAAPATADPNWPAGTILLPFENLEGVMLIEGTLRGAAGRDTAGPLVLDTGAGNLALDAALARWLGIAGRGDTLAAISLAQSPLPRLSLGNFGANGVSPVLTVDAEVVRRVTERPVLGLVGESVLERLAVCIDYRASRLALVPAARTDGARSGAEAVRASRAALRGVIGGGAVAVPFLLAGDGKILVEVRLSNPRPPRFSGPLLLIVDTGATKCVLFEERLSAGVAHSGEWAYLRGLSAPTLMGEARADIARVPGVELGTAERPIRLRDLDVVVIRSALRDVLSRAVGRDVDGLLGYSFLKHYRVTIDYPRRVLWLRREVPDWDDRRFEYSHVGLQLERRDGAARVVAIARGSPAELAGIAAGDEVVAIDGESAAGLDIVALSRRLEGEPGSAVEIAVRGEAGERVFRLVRRRLL